MVRNGIHHVTAISGDPRRNLSFTSRTLGLRLVKKTVNFDDPGSYHLYYGDAAGTPGTILTFFPWAQFPAGQFGAGELQETSFRARMTPWAIGPLGWQHTGPSERSGSATQC